jgi:hypothetical protein
MVLVSIVGLAEWSDSVRCTAAWENAGERSGGYLTDYAATPYLAMMWATHYEPPADQRISAPDFIAACRAGAIWAPTAGHDD